MRRVLNKRTLMGLFLIVVCASIMVTRAIWEGHAALGRGDDAQAQGNTADAIRWWRRAARWYVPGAPHVNSAYERLESLATAAEAKDDARTALAAWSAIRSSVRATRSVYTPFANKLATTDERIAVWMARLDSGSNDDDSSLLSWYQLQLRRDETPSVMWSLVAIFGFAMWIGCGFVFARKGVDDSDRLVPKVAAYCGLGIAIGLLVWLCGLYYA